MKAINRLLSIITIALFIGPAGAEHDPPPQLTTIARSPSGMTVPREDSAEPSDKDASFNHNKSVAIDEDGNVGVGYILEDGDTVKQRLDVFSPDGASAVFESPEISSGFFSTPSVAAMPGNRFSFDWFNETESQDRKPARSYFAFSKNGNLREEEVQADTELPELFGTKDCTPTKLHTDSPPLPVDFFGLTFGPQSGQGVENYRVRYNRTLARCRTGENLVAGTTLKFPPGGGLEIQGTDIGQATPPSNSGGKNQNEPPLGSGTSALGRSRGQTIMAYFARTDTIGEEIVTVLKLDLQGAVTDTMQIEDPRPKGFDPVSIETCGFAAFDHFWVAWSADAEGEDRVAAARIEGNEKRILDLGESEGAVDIACDGWGNAVVSWAGPFDNDSESAMLHTVALGPDGSTLAETKQEVSDLDERGFRDDAVLSNDINEAGDIVVAWSDGGENLAFQRLKLSGHFRIDGALSGSHFNPDFDGEGFIFDVVEIEGTPTMVIYYFTYNDNGSGDPTWLVGSAPIEDNRAVADMITGTGATFGEDFDPGDVERKKAGTVTATFLACGLVKLEHRSNRFGHVVYNAVPLTGIPLGLEGHCGTGADGTAQVDASRGGSLFTPSRDGEGFIFDIVEIDGTPTLVAYYFTYQPDGSGDPAWMVGTGPIEGDSATVTMTIAEGATFGPDFDPADVERTEWGEIQVTWQTCEDVSIEYDGLWGEGSFNVGPLTPALIGATGLCAP